MYSNDVERGVSFLAGLYPNISRVGTLSYEEPDSVRKRCIKIEL